MSLGRMLFLPLPPTGPTPHHPAPQPRKLPHGPTLGLEQEERGEGTGVGTEPQAQSRPTLVPAPPAVRPSPSNPHPPGSPRLLVFLLSLPRPQGEVRHVPVALPPQTFVLPLPPRHTPVILMGAAILSDGRTAASRCCLSVVVSTILEPGKRKLLKTRPSRDWAPPNL